MFISVIGECCIFRTSVLDMSVAPHGVGLLLLLFVG